MFWYRRSIQCRTVPDSAGVGVGGRETSWDGLCGSGGGVVNLDGIDEHETLLIEGQRNFTAERLFGFGARGTATLRYIERIAILAEG